LGSYAELKKANPDTPILVRECSGTEAKLTARFGAWCCQQQQQQQTSMELIEGSLASVQLTASIILAASSSADSVRSSWQSRLHTTELSRDTLSC
jgi:hypothetical protein